MDFIWTKVSEKYIAVAQAFRHFDIQNVFLLFTLQRGKISKNDFTFAIEHLKIKMASSDAQQVFEYLDANKDGFVNYQEFCGLCEERRKNTDPFNKEEALELMRQKYEKQLKLKQMQQARTIEEQDQDLLERMSMASQMYKGFKSNKVKGTKFQNINPNRSFGIGTLPSDNMGKIITH